MANKIFKNGENWFDTDGNIIHAHGGHIVKFNDTYYWYGENRIDNAYVNCYASKDLNNWEFRKNILTTDSNVKDLGFEGNLALTIGDKKINIERPKVIYNKKTGKYIMWAHYENGLNYNEAAIAIASCDTPDGNFTYHGYFRPCSYMSRDCNVFEYEGNMYFISASNENKDLHIYRLTDDYLGVAERVNLLFEGESREAPALFTHNEKIYILTSACTGWRPNRGGYSFSDNILSKWAKLRDFGDDTTYHSQPTSVLNLSVNGKEQHIYIGDRWGGNQWDGHNRKCFAYENSSYYFSLIEIDENGKLILKECDEFTIDLDSNGFEIVK